MFGLRPPAHVLPSPWFPNDVNIAMSPMGSNVAAAAANWPAADRALFVPVSFPADCTLTDIRFRAGNGTGNYDLGFYLADFTRLASTGSTAMSAAGTKTLSLPDIRVRAGEVFYAALALSSGTGTAFRIAYSLLQLVPSQMAQQASALPLPNPATPAALASAYMPVFAFGVR